jgi:hypothetical protein
MVGAEHGVRVTRRGQRVTVSTWFGFRPEQLVPCPRCGCPSYLASFGGVCLSCTLDDDAAAPAEVPSR